MRRVPFGPIAPGRQKQRGVVMFVVTIVIAVLTLGTFGENSTGELAAMFEALK